ncbi:TetR/AcrR family transcriptional regulator [Streptomyces sp. 8L]|uniref:TetR/AcrR family transcriptional regulator n=1 Tax=Streptomyces sp. 8L TaxID=2877242 RepID=UPI001CD69E1C|nr:helix-turn-helix domain-containing protein [Streptomyces sp. 8L]MCA1221994.1 TetR/AcrR family transcriptional regulator [Streptomyces sp. 8L]
MAILGQGQIVAVTVRMLDADGFVDFSMRKLATELNVTPMAIYWHVDSKNDVLELALDAVHGEFTQQALHPSLQ